MLAFLGLELVEELLLVFEHELVDLLGDDLGVFGDLEVQDVGKCADNYKNRVQDVI